MLLLCAALTAGSQEEAESADSAPRSFTILNETGFAMKEIYVRKANSQNWGESIITQPLYSGQSVAVRLGASFDPQSRYSIRMVDIAGDAYSKNNIKIRERSTVRMAIGDFEWDK